jgi:hypothetical protein
MRRKPPTNDQALLKQLITIANALRARKRLPQAFLVLNSALGLIEVLFPPAHQRVAEMLENCAAVLRQLKRDQEEKTYMLRARSIRAKLAEKGSS